MYPNTIAVLSRVFYRRQSPYKTSISVPSTHRNIGPNIAENRGIGAGCVRETNLEQISPLLYASCSGGSTNHQSDHNKESLTLRVSAESARDVSDVSR